MSILPAWRPREVHYERCLEHDNEALSLKPLTKCRVGRKQEQDEDRNHENRLLYSKQKRRLNRTINMPSMIPVNMRVANRRRRRKRLNAERQQKLKKRAIHHARLIVPWWVDFAKPGDHRKYVHAMIARPHYAAARFTIASHPLHFIWLVCSG